LNYIFHTIAKPTEQRFKLIVLVIYRALATVEVAPLAVGEEVEVGWIQVCTSLQFVNQYGTAGL
jgi:hypothetical protein